MTDRFDNDIANFKSIQQYWRWEIENIVTTKFGGLKEYIQSYFIFECALKKWNMNSLNLRASYFRLKPFHCTLYYYLP